MRAFLLLAALLACACSRAEPAAVCKEIAVLYNKEKIAALYKTKFSYQESSSLTQGISLQSPGPYEEAGLPEYFIDINGDASPEYIGTADYGTGHFNYLRIWSKNGKLLSSSADQDDAEFVGSGISIIELHGIYYAIGFIQGNPQIPLNALRIDKEYKPHLACSFKIEASKEVAIINKNHELCKLAQQHRLRHLSLEGEVAKEREPNATSKLSRYDIDNDGENDTVELVSYYSGGGSYSLLSASIPAKEKLESFFMDDVYPSASADIFIFRKKIYIEQRFDDELPLDIHKIGIVKGNAVQTICSFHVLPRISAIDKREDP